MMWTPLKTENILKSIIASEAETLMSVYVSVVKYGRVIREKISVLKCLKWLLMHLAIGL